MASSMEGGPTATGQRAPLTVRGVSLTVLPGGATTRSPACQVPGAPRGRSPAPEGPSAASAQQVEKFRLAPAQGEVAGLLGGGEVADGPQLDEPGQGGPDRGKLVPDRLRLKVVHRRHPSCPLSASSPCAPSASSGAARLPGGNRGNPPISPDAGSPPPSSSAVDVLAGEVGPGPAQ